MALLVLDRESMPSRESSTLALPAATTTARRHSRAVARVELPALPRRPERVDLAQSERPSASANASTTDCGRSK